MPIIADPVSEYAEIYIRAQIARRCCSRPEDFNEETFETLILIGQGMFWSQELESAAKKLAKEVKLSLCVRPAAPAVSRLPADDVFQVRE